MDKMNRYGNVMKETTIRQQNAENMSSLHFFCFVCVCVVSGDFLFTCETSIERQIWASSKPSPLIGGELILVESPQEGAETRHFLLELGARDWLGEVEAWSLIRQD